MNLSPEWQLLLACARVNLTPEDLRLITRELFGPDLDWAHIAKTSCDHGIAPLIYHSFQRSGITRLLPPAATETLRSSYYGNAARNALIFTELRNILIALKEKNIEVIALKGAALAETVYADRALRPMADIDLLVRKENLSAGNDILIGRGYRPDRNNAGWREHHYHWGFFKDVCSMKVHFEIHWNIEHPKRPFKIDIDGMWERALPARVAGVEALVLSPEDLLLHLCHHACKHKLNGIRPLCDIRETIRYYDHQINWQELESRSSEWRIIPYVYLTLRLAKELLDAKVPDSVLGAMRPDALSEGIMDSARERVLGSTRERLFEDNAKRLLELGSVKHRSAMLAEIFSPKAMAKHYWIASASKKIYLYYPIRLKDLCIEYLPVLWCLLRRDRQLTAQAEQANNNSRLEELFASGH